MKFKTDLKTESVCTKSIKWYWKQSSAHIPSGISELYSNSGFVHWCYFYGNPLGKKYGYNYFYPISINLDFGFITGMPQLRTEWARTMVHKSLPQLWKPYMILNTQKMMSKNWVTCYPHFYALIWVTTMLIAVLLGNNSWFSASFLFCL